MNNTDFELLMCKNALQSMAFDLLVCQKIQREIESTQNPYARVMTFKDQMQEEIKDLCNEYVNKAEQDYENGIKVDFWKDYFDRVVENYKNSPEGKKDMEDWNRRIWIDVTCKRCGSKGRVFMPPEYKEKMEKDWQCCPSPRWLSWKWFKELFTSNKATPQT